MVDAAFGLVAGAALATLMCVWLFSESYQGKLQMFIRLCDDHRRETDCHCVVDIQQAIFEELK